ncbi:MAG: insulinase family protein [Deltaproteobacteria bacterium]|nr:insulinase family protein [Deltaproteobacteria bacterium]
MVTVQRPHLHRAVLSAYIHVGSRHETPGTNGLSHFLEHMLFRGIRRLPTASAFNHQVEALGGSLAAATHGDFTRFELTLPPGALADGAQLLGEVFTEPVFSDREVETGIVREEILEDLDEDGTDINADNVVRARVFLGHPLAMPITGSVKNVERFTERHLREHLGRYYRARNMAVVVAGPMAHRTMQRAVTRAFSGLEPGAASAPVAFRPSQSRLRTSLVTHPGSQSAVRLAFPTVGLRSPRSRHLELLLRVLDDGMSTRLHRRICDERGLAYEVNGAIELFDDAGIFDVASSVAHDSVDSLLGEVLSILGELCQDGPTRDEVEKVHRRYAFDLDTLEDDAHGLCDYYGTSELFEDRQSPAERRREVLAVTAQDLRRAARTTFDPRRLSLVRVGPRERDGRERLQALARTYRERFARACLTRFPRFPGRGRLELQRPRAPVLSVAKARTSSLDRAGVFS